MAYVNFNRALTRAEIEALTNATNGKIYFAKDGGIYVGKSDGTAEEKADLSTKIELKPNQEFVYRKTTNTIKAKSLTLDRIYGKTLAWNQQIRNFESSASTTINGITITDNRDGSYSVSGTASAVATLRLPGPNTIPYHKYLLIGCPSGGSTSSYCLRSAMYGFKDTGSGAIWYNNNSSYTYNISIDITVMSGTVISTPIKFWPNVIDLTILYGSEIDGLTDAQILAKYESEYPGYHAYNPGALISNDAAAIETVGFNQWDEEWEKGAFDTTTGTPVSASDQIRSKNLIPVLPNTDYYCKSPTGVWAMLLDHDGNVIPISEWSGGSYEANNCRAIHGSVFHTANNAAWLKFYVTTDYGSTYNHDICINVSNPSRNGQYEPYKKSVCPLNIKTRKGKLNGQGASVVVFPDGMNGVGTSFDEAHRTKGTKRRARVNLGTLTYEMYNTEQGRLFRAVLNDIANVGENSALNAISAIYVVVPYVSRAEKTISQALPGSIDIIDSSYTDAASFKAAMNGVYLDYELVEPQEYVWDEPLPTSMPAGTTEARISPNADGLSAPFCADMTYGMGATEYAETAGVAIYAINTSWSAGDGNNSVVLKGSNGKAFGENSVVEGIDTVAYNRAEHAEGEGNVSNTGSTAETKTRHSVGIGDENNRKNAFEIMQNGDAYLYGIGGYNGTNPSQAQSVKTVIDGLENEISRIDEVFAAALVDLNTKLEGIEVLLSEI